MRYFNYVDKELFYIEPINFNKRINKEILKYAVGANLYMNGMRDFYNKIISGDFVGVGCISICFENATKDSEVKLCEDNVVDMLNKLDEYVKLNSDFNLDNIPLIFFRVRNYMQFIQFTEKLDENHYKYIAGFIFPKFNSMNGDEYLNYIKELSCRYDEILYAMPILESEEIIYKESRLDELIRIKNIINDYKDIVLNIRVGGTDFSSKFGLRRSVDSNIYNVRVVSECLIDIINIFLREDAGFVVSAPVWEYFSDDVNSKEIQGLINEIKSDKENGFCGKTVIHPNQTKYVNSIYTVTYEEYIDALNILRSAEDGGVFKGYGNNKMNEVRPHYNWANKIVCRAKVFGVLNKGICQEELYKTNNIIDQYKSIKIKDKNAKVI